MVDRRSGSFPLPGRNGASSSSSGLSELQAHLSRRLRIVEGGHSTPGPAGPPRASDGSGSAPVGPPVRHLRSVSPVGPPRSSTSSCTDLRSGSKGSTSNCADIRNNVNQGMVAGAGNINSDNRHGPAQGGKQPALSPRALQMSMLGGSATPTPRNSPLAGSSTPTSGSMHPRGVNWPRAESPIQRQAFGGTASPCFNALPPHRIRRQHFEQKHHQVFHAPREGGQRGSIGSVDSPMWLADVEGKRPPLEKPLSKMAPAKEPERFSKETNQAVIALKAECEALKRDKIALEEQLKKEAEARAAVQFEKIQLEQTRDEQVEAFTKQCESLKEQQLIIAEQIRHSESISQEVEELRQQRLQYTEGHQLILADRTVAYRRVQELQEELQEERARHEQAQQDLIEESLVNQRLAIENAQLKADQELSQERHVEFPSACSESRLRAAMTQPSTTTDDLLQAVAAVEALLGEARREVATRQLRERRAAYEELHHAMEKADEAILAVALSEARRCGIDAEDLAKAQAKLEQLQSLTDEQRAAQAAQEAKVKIKAAAFQLVKKDDGRALVELLAGLPENGLPATSWQDWRDYAGRSLQQFAKEMRASSAQKSLAELLDRQKPRELVRTAVATPEIAARPQEAVSTAKVVPAEAVEELPSLSSAGKVQAAAHNPLHPGQPSPEVDNPDEFEKPKEEGFGKQFKLMNLCEEMFSMETTSPDSAVSDATSPPSPSDATPKEALPVVSPEEEAQFKQKALRAVVQDDVVALSAVIERLPVELWSAWQNKAGKDLVTLSQERGSTCAYSVLAKALGWLKEQKREVFEEREAVWVMVKGELQPRQATVMEDTPEEADHILVEYWDGNDPPSYVERALVLKSCAR